MPAVQENFHHSAHLVATVWPLQLLLSATGFGIAPPDRPLGAISPSLQGPQSIARRHRYLFNLRNHRKVQIIDGNIAFVGGMNVGIEYQGLNPKVGPWRDLQVEFTGPLVVAVVGLGYVGLPLLLAAAQRGFPTLGFDIDPAKVETLNAGGSYIQRISAADVAAM